MSSRKLTRELLKEWSYGNEIIEASESECDGDAASFDNSVIHILGAEGLLEFAADPKCVYRSYFANQLASMYLWSFRSSGDLPFHFSRFLGVKTKEVFSQEKADRESKIYEICVVVDSMRNIKDPAIQSLYKQLLDFRHDHTASNREFYYKCCSSLGFELFDVV